MKVLTVDDLKKMMPGTIFASGVGLIEHPWFDYAKKVSQGGTLEDDGRSTKVKWVAVRGTINDWAIYHSMDANLVRADYFDDPMHLKASIDQIRRGGAKLVNVVDVKKFVPCDDEALALYRF